MVFPPFSDCFVCVPPDEGIAGVPLPGCRLVTCRQLAECCERFARSPRAVLCSGRSETLCSEAAKKLVFSIMIKMQRNECMCVYI